MEPTPYVMITRSLNSTLLTILFFISFSHLIAQTSDCGTCLTARPDSLVTFAVMHLSWEQGGTIQSTILPWQPGDTTLVACGEDLNNVGMRYRCYGPAFAYEARFKLFVTAVLFAQNLDSDGAL